MAQLSVEALKRHIVVADDAVEEDDLILEYQAAAENWIQEHLRRDLDTEFGAEWPKTCQQVIRIMVADYYDNRGAIIVGASAQVLPLVTALLAPFRNFNSTA